MEMKNRFQEAIQNVQRQRHLARRSLAMVLVLAMLTSMSVSWRLHQDGIALAADDVRYYCGKEEHEHTDDCYIEGTEPICGYEEGEIIEEASDSVDDAWNDDSSIADWDEAESEPESEPVTLEEPEPEVVLHHHTSDCYEEEEVLTCGIESDHIHQDYCYDQETGDLLCTEHEHDDDCYTLEDVLVCGYEEGEPEETDDGIALYDMDENSADESDFVEEPETAADPEPEKEVARPEADDEIDAGYTVHHHTDECYGKVLICGKEEHEHTADCLINPNAEIDAEYDAKTPARTSTDWAEDMVLVAQSQLGYTESKADVDEDGNGYTMYADQYYKDKPMVYADWDSTFVAYCLYHAGVPQDVIPQYASISALRGELARMNSEYYTDDPQNFASILPGDIVMYKNIDGHETVGVVSDVAADEETGLTTALTVISGDVATGYESDGETTIDQVAEVEVALSDVTSFVSVNGAEGYGVDDLMGDDVAVQDMTQEELLEALEKAEDFGKYIPKDGIKAEHTKFVTDTKESYKSDITVNFKVSKDTVKDDIKADKYYRIDLPSGLELDSQYMDELMKNTHSLKEDGVEIGKYRFVKNKTGGYSILLKFDETYLKNDPELVGKIKFTGEIGVEYGQEDGSIEIPFHDNETLEIPAKDVVYPSDKTNYYDIDVTKKGSYAKDGKLTYMVDVISKKGTPDNVAYHDEITNLGDLNLGTPTIVVKRYTVTETRTSTEENWPGYGGNVSKEEEVTPSGLEYSGNGKIDGTLPKMETTVSKDGLMRTYTKYQVTYVYDGIENMGDKDYDLKNTVKTSSNGNVEIEDESSADVKINNQYTLKKTAGSYQDGKIEWTITFNENNRDITGATLTDSMVVDKTSIPNVFANAGDLTVTPETGWVYVKDEDGKITGIQFTAADGETNTGTYKITYTTKHEQAGSDYKVNNTAHANLTNGGEVDDAVKEVTVPKRGIQKYADKSNVTEEGNVLTIPWRVSIDFTNASTLKKDTVFKDNFTLQNTHWMTKAQAKALAENLMWSDAVYNETNLNSSTSDVKVNSGVFRVEFYTSSPLNDKDLNQAGTVWSELTEDAKIYGFRIVVNDDFTLPTDKKVLKVNYSTTADISKADTSTIYRNVFEGAGYNYSYNKSTITKTDGDGETGTSTVVSDDNSITWKIQVKTNSVGLHQKLTVQDVLPKGVTLKSIHVTLPNTPSEIGPLELTADKTTNEGNRNNDKLTGTYDPSTNELTMELSNPNYLMRSFTYVFTVKCEVVSDKGGNAIVPGKTYEFKNKASAWYDGDENAKIGESSQTQDWSEKDSSIVEKPLGKSVNATDGNQKLEYTVEINPDGQDLLANAENALTVRDTLSVQFHPDYVYVKQDQQGNAQLVTVDARLVETSVELYYAEKGEDGKLKAGKKVEGYKLTLDSYLDPTNTSRMLYVIRLTDVPDDVPLLFKYTYEIVSDIDIVYPDGWVNYGWYGDDKNIRNTVELEGTSYQPDTIKTATEIKRSATSGDVISSYRLTLKKVEKGSYRKLLPGATFELQKYADSGFTPVDKAYTTDANGTITIRKDDGFAFQTNTLYRLVETKAPDGYKNLTMDEAVANAVYFYFSDEKNTDCILPDIPEKDKAVDLSKQSKQVYVENEPNLTEVTVEKKWIDTEGNKIEDPPESIQFELVQMVSGTPPISSNTATVKGTIVTGWSGSTNEAWPSLFDSTTPYPEGTELTFTISYPHVRNAIEWGNHIPHIYWNGAELLPNRTWDGKYDDNGPVHWTYTCTLRAGQNVISGYIEGFDSGHTISQRVFDVPVAPEYTEKCAYGDSPYTLSAANNWRMTISDLPRSGLAEDGTTTEYYSYKVRELNVPGDYEVSYNTENGVVDGRIVMVNTKTPEPEEPVYELPSTGSPGGTVPYTAGGAAIALAAVLCGYNSRRKRKREEE